MTSWDTLELAIDTPYDPQFPWLQPARTRPNRLDLSRLWLKADSATSPHLPVPPHLRLLWKEGLPYWAELDGVELEATWNYVHGVIHLLEEQQTRLALDIAYWGYAAPGAGRAHPAFTPLYVPLNVAPRYPRYAHSHTDGVVLAEHPPVKVQKPRGKSDLPHLVARALTEENITAWPAPGLPAPEGYGAIAIVTAPWFGTLAGSADVELTAEAIAKVDHFLFAPFRLIEGADPLSLFHRHQHRHEHLHGHSHSHATAHHHANSLVEVCLR
ncbi:MAG TPA: hypothetical protein VH186_15770 [Chloroflexia bacterium]|nr:hypothetical protein [Chloroflexia bacterium]